MGLLFFYLHHVLLVYLAIQIVRLCFAGREPWRQILVGVAVIPLLIQFIILSLSTLRQLHTTAITLMLISFSAVLFCRNFCFRHKAPSFVSPEIPFRSMTRRTSMLLLAMFTGGLTLGCRLIQGTCFHRDDLSYHGPFVAHWMLNEGICWAPYNYHAYYPFNAELLSLWLVVPLKNDAFVGLAGVYWLILLAVTVTAIGRLQGYSGAACGLAAIICCSSTVVLASCHSFSAVDLAAAASFLAGLTFILPGGSKKPINYTDLVFAGLLCGYAVGCKVSYLPMLFIASLCVVYRVKKSSMRKVLIACGLFTLALIATGSFWYIRNLLTTGNPIFPAELGPLDGPLTSKMLQPTKLITHLQTASNDISALIAIVERHVHWPSGVFLVCLGGYAAAIIAIIRKRPLNTIHKPTIVILLSIGLFYMLLYPWMPFTAGGFSSETILISTRYLILPFVIGIVLLMPCLTGRSLRTFLIRAFALILLTLPWNMSLARSGVLLVIVTLLFLCLRLAPSLLNHLNPLLKQPPFLLALGVVFFLGWIACYSIQKRQTEENLFDHYGDTARPIGQAWKVVNQLPPGSRVLALGPALYEYYPLFGRDFLLRPLPRPRAYMMDHFVPYHRLFQQNPSLTLRELHQKRLSSIELLNWAGKHSDYILVSKWDKATWPEIQAILKTSDIVTSVYDDGYSALWQITPQR